MEPSKLSEALSKVQAKLRPILKEADNPFFKSKYADLPSVCEAVLPLLSSEGLALTQEGVFIGPTNETFALKTTIRHPNGETVSSLWPVISKDHSAQGTGSGSTYARRYALMALVGVSASDDDGNEAQGITTNTTKPPVKNYAPNSDPGEYEIKFGKWTGVKLRTMKDSDLKVSYDWAKTVKDPKPGLVEFIKAVETYQKSVPTINKDEVIPF